MKGVQKDPLPPDDLRCKRTDGRQWRCKSASLPGKSYCEPHLLRLLSMKKPPKPKLNYNLTPPPLGNSNPTPTPTRVRFRVRLKPPPDSSPAPEPNARAVVDALPVNVHVPCAKSRDVEVVPQQVIDGYTPPHSLFNTTTNNSNNSPQISVGPTAMLPPADVAPAIEERDKYDFDNKRENVMRGGGVIVFAGDDVAPGEEERGNNVVRSSENEAVVVVAMPEEGRRCRRNSGRGWRCDRLAKEGHTMCDVHIDKAKIKRSKAEGLKRKPVVKVKPLAGSGQGLDLAENLRCTRNDGKKWRCKERVLEGQNLCEAHFKGIKLSDVKGLGSEVGKKPKKKRRRKDTDSKENKDKKSGKKAKGDVGCGGVVIKQEIEEFEEGNQLAMVADLAVAEAEAEAEAKGLKKRETENKEKEKDKDKEEWRCKRTDGRGWRCKQRVLEGKTLCVIHFEQGRCRQKKISVPESLKIQKGEGGERIEKNLKRKKALETLESNSDKGMKRMKAELIRVFLRREIIEQNKKKSEKSSVGSSNNGGEVTRDLPYGLMAIPPAPPTQLLDNAESLGIKVGVHCSNTLVNRRFRSKNIEPPPVGALKVLPFPGNVEKVKNSGRRKCHWCRKSDKSSLIKCLSCKKRFFCHSCVKERYTDPEEVKVKCPVCHGSCSCKLCLKNQPQTVGIKDTLKQKIKGSKFQQLQYLINLLLPVLEQINQEQSVETEMEAKNKGQNPSEVEIRQADIGCRDQCCCNNCKTPILDFHRSCPNCSYNLCLSCCREYSQGGFLRGVSAPCSQCPDVRKAHPFAPKTCSEKIHKNSSIQSTDYAESTPCLRISCPPMELGGCDNSLLDLRCIFPLNWTKELEISAKETAGDDFPLTGDDSEPCSSCASIVRASLKNKEVQEASSRRGSCDNFLYCPSSSDDHHDVLAHFQRHWRKGHPVKFRNVLQCASSLSWDPLALLCSYLENSYSNCETIKDSAEAINCSDCYEVEIGMRESFAQSVGEGSAHRRQETLKVKAKFSSTLSRRLLGDHYSAVILALPLQEYTNPRSGLLNIAGKLPEDFPDSKLGPHICISFGSRDVVARGDLITKLHCNLYDVVDVLVHVDSAPCSTEQLNKIKKVMRRNSTKDKGDHISLNVEKETRMQSKISVEAGGQDRFMEGTVLGHGVNGASCCSAATNEAAAVNVSEDKSPAKLQSSDTDSDTSMICSGTSDSPYKSMDHVSHLERLESSNITEKRPPLELCGAQWDVFRRQDIPKLLEYIRKHVDELSFSYDFPNSVVHPIFDGSFYLDVTHKLQLKEEYDVEPWTFNQCLGEAVLIPAGCPYQMRNVKSCVNIALGFISPEHASECIKLINEVRALPNDHKAKQAKLEVEKMTICSVDEAIKEIYRLRSTGGDYINTGSLVPIANS